jgi:2-phosphoglycerate kinase
VGEEVCWAMLYLIGGPPRSGKTILAAALARRTFLPYFSIDHIAQVIIPYIPEDDHAAKLPLRVAIREAAYSNDVFYTNHSPEEAVALYERQARTIWPGVENFIRYALNADHDLIIEGWQIIPARLRAIVEARDRAQAVFLYKLNEVDIVSGLKSHTAKNDWVVQNTRSEETFNAIGKMISCFGSIIAREATLNDFRAVNTDIDFEASITRTLESLLT